MKTPKLLFAVAMAFAALSFTFKANAQTDPMVYLSYSDSNWPAPFPGAYGYIPERYVNWEVTLHDVNSNEDFVFDTDSWKEGENLDYELGTVPVGYYTTTVQHYTGSLDMFADWNINVNGMDSDADSMSGMIENAYDGNLSLLSDWNHTDNALYVHTGMGISIIRF